MKIGPIVLIVIVLVACILAMASIKGRQAEGQAFVLLAGITNDAAGKPLALLCFTNASAVPVFGSPHSVNYRLATGWADRAVPKTLDAEIPYLELAPHTSRTLAVHFPTNIPWKYRVWYHEEPRGAKRVLLKAGDVACILFHRPKYN